MQNGGGLGCASEPVPLHLSRICSLPFGTPVDALAHIWYNYSPLLQRADTFTDFLC